MPASSSASGASRSCRPSTPPGAAAGSSARRSAALLIAHGASAQLQLGVEAAIGLAIMLWATAPHRRRRHPCGRKGLRAARGQAHRARHHRACWRCSRKPQSPTGARSISAANSAGRRARRPAGFSAYAGMMFVARALGDGVVRRLGRSETILYRRGAHLRRRRSRRRARLALAGGDRLLPHRPGRRQHGPRRIQRERRGGADARRSASQ